jgi:hypothetical protein
MDETNINQVALQLCAKIAIKMLELDTCYKNSMFIPIHCLKEVLDKALNEANCVIIHKSEIQQPLKQV